MGPASGSWKYYKVNNPFGAEAGIFCVNYVKTLTADALAPCISRPSPMILTKQDNWELVFHKKRFRLPVPSQYIMQIYFHSPSKQYSMYRVNSLWPSGVIWCHGSVSPLVQVMACCHLPSLYLNQCYCQLDPQAGTNIVKLESKYEDFHWIKCL